MGLFSRKSGKGPKGAAAGDPKVTIWVRDNNPDEILLSTLLHRLNTESPGQLPQAVRDSLDGKTPFKNIRFIKTPNPEKGGTNVTCIFEG